MKIIPRFLLSGFIEVLKHKSYAECARNQSICDKLDSLLSFELFIYSVWLSKLTMLDMTPLGLLGHKTLTQANKPTHTFALF